MGAVHMFSYDHSLHSGLEVRELLVHLHHNIHEIMSVLSNIQDQNTALIAAVKDEDTVIDGAVVALTGVATQIGNLQKQLADAIAAGDPAAIQAVADSLKATTDDITAKKAALAAAIAAVPAA